MSDDVFVTTLRVTAKSDEWIGQLWLRTQEGLEPIDPDTVGVTRIAAELQPALKLLRTLGGGRMLVVHENLE